MEKKEYELEVACRLLARESGWVMLKLEKNGHKGVPDDLLISPEGKCKLIEFKKLTYIVCSSTTIVILHIHLIEFLVYAWSMLMV